jgi:SSS family solute:Na+ symporter
MNLTQDEVLILSLIRQGHETMAELIDVSGLSGDKANAAIETLDFNRLIERAGFIGANFWTFCLTEKGKKELPSLNSDEERMAKFGLWTNDLAALKLFEKAGVVMASEYIQKNITDAGQRLSIVASVYKLLRKGYLDELGFMRRRIQINEKGRNLLKSVM